MIKEFRGDYRWLSNFYQLETPIVDEHGYSYATVEHYYVSRKTSVPFIRYSISNLATPGEAKRFGRKMKSAPKGWDNTRIDVMFDALTHKFSDVNPVLKRQLIETGDMPIYEGNTWGDEFWGVNNVTLKGKNLLGIMIMDIRVNIQ